MTNAKMLHHVTYKGYQLSVFDDGSVWLDTEVADPADHQNHDGLVIGCAVEPADPAAGVADACVTLAALGAFLTNALVTFAPKRQL